MVASKRLLITGVVAVAVVVASGRTVEANLIVNGGFETGNLTGWTLAPGGPFDAVCLNGAPIGAATCAAHGGSFAMSFGLNGGQDTLTQFVPTVAGQRYDLSFFLANDIFNGVGTWTFSAYWDGSLIFATANPPAFPYGPNAFSNLTAGTSSTPLVFVAQHDPSQWFLDDVSVQAVPEPSTLLLLGAGLLAAGRRFRSRRQ